MLAMFSFFFISNWPTLESCFGYLSAYPVRLAFLRGAYQGWSGRTGNPYPWHHVHLRTYILVCIPWMARCITVGQTYMILVSVPFNPVACIRTKVKRGSQDPLLNRLWFLEYSQCARVRRPRSVGFYMWALHLFVSQRVDLCKFPVEGGLGVTS